MKSFLIFSLLLIALVNCQEEATYKLTFQGTWSSSSVANEHFSPIIGCAHKVGTNFWSTGSLASTGIKNVAETGSQTPLNTEINALVAAQSCKSLIADSGTLNSPGTKTYTIKMTKTFRLISLVSMIAPSPDWFVGVNSLDLYPSNSWVENLKVDLRGYDAGTDSGNSFAAANQATSPAVAINTLSAAHSTITPQFFGTFTFKLESSKSPSSPSKNSPSGPSKNSPAPSKNSPAPSKNSPAPSKNSPAPSKNSPAPSKNSPAPSNNSPAPSNNSPAPSNNSPSTRSPNPTPSNDSPSTRSPNPTPSNDSPSTKSPSPSPRNSGSSPSI